MRAPASVYVYVYGGPGKGALANKLATRSLALNCARLGVDGAEARSASGDGASAGRPPWLSWVHDAQWRPADSFLARGRSFSVCKTPRQISALYC